MTQTQPVAAPADAHLHENWARTMFGPDLMPTLHRADLETPAAYLSRLQWLSDQLDDQEDIVNSRERELRAARALRDRYGEARGLLEDLVTLIDARTRGVPEAHLDHSGEAPATAATVATVTEVMNRPAEIMAALAAPPSPAAAQALTDLGIEVNAEVPPPAPDPESAAPDPVGETEEPAPAAPPLLEPDPAPMPDPAPADPADDREDAPPALNQQQRLTAWAARLTGDAEFTVAQIAELTDMNPNSAGVYLPRLARAGHLERVPGTGGQTGAPARYRRPGSGGEEIRQPTPAPASPPAPKPWEGKPPSLPREIPPFRASGASLAPVQVTPVLRALGDHGRPMSRSLLLNCLQAAGVGDDQLTSVLEHLISEGRVRLTDDQRYTLAPDGTA